MSIFRTKLWTSETQNLKPSQHRIQEGIPQEILLRYQKILTN